MSDRTGIMLPIPFTEEKFEAMPKPVIVQTKLEGDRLRALSNPTVLLSSGAKERISVPHIALELQEMGLEYETDGELYVHGVPHSEIRSIVSRTKNRHPDYHFMEYHIYDLITDDDQAARIEMMQPLIDQQPHIKVVPSYQCWTMDDLQKYYDIFLEQGYEGIIVRHSGRPYKRSQVQWMLKLKPRLSGVFLIVGVLPLVDKHGKVQDTMGSFVLQDEEGRKFNVGTGPTAHDRMLFWFNQESLIQQSCKIRFQGYTKARHVPKMQSIDKEWLAGMRKLLQ